MNKNNEMEASNKKAKNLPVPLSKKAKLNLIGLQGLYQSKYKEKINLKALGTIIFENATAEVI